MASAVIDLEPSENETDSEEIPRGGSASTKRSLGLEVIFSAVSDYRHGSGTARASAEAFLFPTTADCRSRFDLIVSICDADRAWLRDSLDRARPGWDRERQRGKADESKEINEAA